MKPVHIALLYVDEHDKDNWMNVLRVAENAEATAINLSGGYWWEECHRKDYDIYILRPPGMTNLHKSMFDERVRIFSANKRALFYPSILECELYENKKFLSYWLRANDIPHPATRVFYNKQEALAWVSKAAYPLVGKINIGASGKGVRILYRESDAVKYVSTAFDKGLKPYIGPNLKHGRIIKKISNAIRKKGLVGKRVKSYTAIMAESQQYCIFQEFIKHGFEWRVVIIGESYFAHKKLLHEQKASGSLRKDYSDPPLRLLDFAREIFMKNSFLSVSMDIFQSGEGFLVNEIQCYFGQSDSFQMKVNGVEGRYVYKNEWVFEAGDFARNQCYNLRLEHILQLHNSRQESLKQ
ncbi:MAG: hypothetical protein PHY24_07670 [Candidatus Cloacimonetes bacterium]|nr:hypothetical protein [Candidatus Cloacimonadota bacterium]